MQMNLNTMWEQSIPVSYTHLEEEISELDDEDKKEFLEAIGLTESGVDKLTRAAYHLLGLGTYFTAGEKEVRAWTFKRGMKAPQAAGIIHSDFEKGFIRAVTMSLSLIHIQIFFQSILQFHL